MAKLMETVFIKSEPKVDAAEATPLEGPFTESGWGLWDEAVAKLDEQIAAQNQPAGKQDDAAGK
jgi:hypothetical protein